MTGNPEVGVEKPTCGYRSVYRNLDYFRVADDRGIYKQLTCSFLQCTFSFALTAAEQTRGGERLS